jgi:flagellar basal-body rod protein FlgB
MPINFDKALGSHQKALMLQARRSALISSNIVNADTPNYKARDIDFRQALSKADMDRLPLTRDSSTHLRGDAIDAMGVQLKYRIPMQASMDGNTVDMDLEKSAFADNAIRYQFTLRMLSGRFKGMMNALKGE